MLHSGLIICSKSHKNKIDNIKTDLEQYDIKYKLSQEKMRDLISSNQNLQEEYNKLYMNIKKYYELKNTLKVTKEHNKILEEE